MPTTYSRTIHAQGKELTLLAVNLSNAIDLPDLSKIAQPVLDELAPYLKRKRQAVYIRDMPSATATKERPGGGSYIPEEAHIAVHSWPADLKLVQATLFHELHHMVRFQHNNYQGTLGSAIVPEGVATYYEEYKTGLKPPWA